MIIVKKIVIISFIFVFKSIVVIEFYKGWILFFFKENDLGRYYYFFVKI